MQAKRVSERGTVEDGGISKTRGKIFISTIFYDEAVVSALGPSAPSF